MLFKFVIAALFIASPSLVRAQNVQAIYSFTNAAGANRLTLGTDGNFYGTTKAGGTSNYGTVFQVTTNGAFTTLYSFTFYGAQPTALTLGNDGNFYGMTFYGGTNGRGSVFQITTNGTLTTLDSFTTGSYPEACLTLGNDGNFYGTTAYGGTGGNVGTVFQVTTSGTLTTLCSFPGQSAGEYPALPLTLADDGNFYGIAEAESGNGYWALFRVSTTGTLTGLLYGPANHGQTPNALTLGTDGNFYGTTQGGGTNGSGTIFQMTTNGTMITLASFNSTDGANPSAAFTLGADGNFYGTTQGGGNGGNGTIFQATPIGTLTTLGLFDGTNGAEPNGLTLGPDGNFYGTTMDGGNGYGTVFRLLLSPLITVQPQSKTNNAGATVTFSVSATSLYATGYQWQRNGTNLVNAGNISGATSSTLTIMPISDGDAASYSVILTNAKGSVLSSNATLTVIDAPTIAAQPTNVLVLVGSNVTFAATVTGTPPFHYQWLFDGTNMLYGGNAMYTIPSAQTNNAGSYSVMVSNPAGGVTSSNSALTVVQSPTSQTNYASSTATFTVTAISPESLNYQWQKNGTNLSNSGNISGATNNALTIANVSDADAANYTAVVRDVYTGVTTATATLTVDDSLIFVTEPLSQTVGTGTRVTFTASVYGAPPFVFQWFSNQAPIGSPTSGANVSSLTLTNVATNQSGEYSVQVFNASGSLTSSNAVLTVIQPPTLGLQILAGYPVLNLYGTVGNSFMVQYNPNLAGTNWVNLSLINLTSNPFQFLDPSGVGQPARFYRVFFTH